jgi:TrmH family RNA methyltransferase
MKTISSRQNALFKRVRDATHEHAEEIVIEGPKAVADAIAAGWKAIVVVGSERSGAPGDVQRAAQPTPIPRDARDDIVVFSDALFNDVSDTKTSQGVLALFERPHPALDDVFGENVVIALDGVQDPGNVGTIVRLAAAFDAGGVVTLPGTADPFAPKAIRASAGAILTVPAVAASREQLIARGWPLFAADPRGEPVDPPTRRAVLVFGNEGSGISETIARVARPIAIPMSPRVESLNVASSAAILLARSYALRTAP